jgi:hypothetical protein
MPVTICLLCKPYNGRCAWEWYKSRAIELGYELEDERRTNKSIRFRLYDDYNHARYGRSRDEKVPECVQWGIRDLYPEPSRHYSTK